MTSGRYAFREIQRKYRISFVQRYYRSVNHRSERRDMGKGLKRYYILAALTLAASAAGVGSAMAAGQAHVQWESFEATYSDPDQGEWAHVDAFEVTENSSGAKGGPTYTG